MKSEQLNELLENVATQLGVQVSYETLGVAGALGGGGLCKLRGQWRLIIDKKAAPNDRTPVLIDALAQFDTANFELPPKVREMLDARRALIHPAGTPLKG